MAHNEIFKVPVISNNNNKVNETRPHSHVLHNHNERRLGAAAHVSHERLARALCRDAPGTHSMLYTILLILILICGFRDNVFLSR